MAIRRRLFRGRRKHPSIDSTLVKRPMMRWFPLFMGPTVLAFALGFVWPFVQGFYLSFTKFRTTSDAKFLGIAHLFDNYKNAFSDPSFLHAFWYTALFTVVSVIFINVLAFTVA